MITPDLIDSLCRAHAQLPRATWTKLREQTRATTGMVTKESLNEFVIGMTNRDTAWSLAETLVSPSPASWEEVATAMLTIERIKESANGPVSVIWTGPSSNRFSARRTDQVLYDLLAKAEKRALIVTFAAHGIRRFCDALGAAQGRGVHVTLLLETEDGSAGQLSRDALAAFQGLPLAEIEVLHWPRQARETNAAGRPGKLHAKCAVIDDMVVVGSANLTDDAFNRNMELGLVTTDPVLAEAIIDHFQELQAEGLLRRVMVE
jgi:cardiolipin synthase